MRNLKTVEVYRYDEKKNVWSKNSISGVFVSGTGENYELSDTLSKRASLSLRVFGNLSCDVAVGDVISLEKNDGELPPQKSYTVVSVTKNEHGYKTSHTKILCR